MTDLLDTGADTIHDAEPVGAITTLGADVTFDTTDRYDVGTLLGTGGSGEVHACRDRRIGRTVARKTLHAGKTDVDRTRRRFLREARVQGQLEHPAIVPVYEIGTDPQGIPFFTMRRIKGETLESVLRDLARKAPEAMARHTRRRLLTGFTNVCLAVHYAHTRGVIHRDLKPGNIMLGSFGEVYVVDWGLAKVRAVADDTDELSDESLELTAHGTILGTAGYMAPEQVRGEVSRIDARSDVYALGVILFEMLALRSIHGDGGTLTKLATTAFTGVDAHVRKWAPDVAVELEEICVRATALDPIARFQSARDLADAVERVLDGEGSAEQKRVAAQRHANDARAAVERAGANGEGRVLAMREVISALALEPEQPDARKVLRRLLTESPDELPPEARAARETNARTTRRLGARLAFWGYVSWLATVPAVALLGIRNMALFLGCAIATVISAVWAGYMWRADLTKTRHGVVLAVLNAVTITSLSCWLGPFVLVPTAASVSTTLFAVYAARRERALVTALGVLGGILPFVLEFAHVFPRAYAFRGDELVLFARAFAFPPGLTQFALVYVTVTFTLLPAIFLARMHDSLQSAEERQFLQAWHLSKLADGGAV